MTVAVVAAAAVAVESKELGVGSEVVLSAQTYHRAMQGFSTEVRGMKKEVGLAGRAERAVAQKAKPMLREALREVLPAHADSCPPDCPVCGAKLENARVRERTIRTQWGEVTIAVRQGALQAKRGIMVADGGTWIWKIAEDRFPGAERTLDSYHGTEHLWALAQALHGEGTAEARAWFNPLKRQLLQKGGAPVIQTLRDRVAVSAALPALPALQHELTYFEKRKGDLDYPAKRRRGEPVGSGAIESGCKQYQVRFKRGGQFWSRRWDEGLLELKSRQLSGRWDELWPHLYQPN